MKQQGKTIRDYIYSSEMTMRPKFSLKNLIVQDSGLQRNYASQQSERIHQSSSRPQTMYGQRVRMLINDQNKKLKMQTQIKMRRQQSSYKITRSNSGIQVKTVSNQDKIRMKKSLGKINLLAQGNFQCSQQQQLQSIFSFLNCLSQVDNHYQNAFKYLYSKMKFHVFANSTSQIGQQIKKLADKTKNQALIQFVYRDLGKTTYAKLSRQLLIQTQRAVQRMQEAQKNQTSGQQKNIQIIKQKQDLIKKLKRQLKYYQEHPSQDLYPYVKKLERENKQMKQQIQQLLYMKGQNQYKIQIIQTGNLLLSQQIQSLKGRIYELQLQQLSGEKQTQKNSQLKLFQQNITSLKDMLDKSKLKMEGMKEQYEKVRQHNQELINQRSLLAKRAAVGFGQLTPRPNIKNIFKQNGLIYENYVNLNAKNTTTQNITKSLVEKLKIASIHMPKKQSKTPVIVQKQSDSSGDEMQNTIKYIDETKNQIKRTQEAVQIVKKSFSQQASQKQALQKNRNTKK